MKQDLFVKMMSATEDEVNAMADTGLFNSIIKGYLVATLKQLNFTSDDIGDAVDALTDILDAMPAEEARQLYKSELF